MNGKGKREWELLGAIAIAIVIVLVVVLSYLWVEATATGDDTKLQKTLETLEWWGIAILVVLGLGILAAIGFGIWRLVQWYGDHYR